MPNNDIITTIRQISDLITKTELTAEDLAGQLGTINEKVMDQFEVTPTFDGINSATVMPQSMSDEPSHVRLKLSDGVTLDALKEALGDYQKTPRMPRKPPKGMFTIDTSSDSHRVTLIVELDSDTPSNLTLRRDIIL